MNDKSNNEHLKPNDVSVRKEGASSEPRDENQNAEINISSMEILPNNESDGASASINSRSQHLSSNYVYDASKLLINETSNPSEMTDTFCEKSETFRPTFKLPREPQTPCCEREVVGDDFSKKSELHILCECEPTVAGAAVPIVKSCIPNQNNSTIKCNISNCNLPEKEQEIIDLCPDRLGSPENGNLKCKKPVKHVSKIYQTDEENEKIPSDRNVKYSPQNKHNPKYIPEKSCPEKKGYVKKPSLIPKLTRNPSVISKNLDYAKNETDKCDNVMNSRVKIDISKQPLKSISNNIKLKETRNQVYNKVDKSENSRLLANANTISSRMLGLQQRLKATTSMLRKKFEVDKSKEKVRCEESCTDVSGEEEINDLTETTKGTVDDLYKSISHLKEAASALSEHSSLKSQAKYIEKLFLNISEIKLIADKLCMREQVKSKSDILDESNILVEKEKPHKISTTNAKDNKIYIKFMHSKDRKYEGRRRRKDLSPEQSEEVQDDLGLGSKATSDSLNSEACSTEKSQEENKVKEADSMDGVFIPSCDPPKNMEEDEETNGLDITITFPEFSQLYSSGTESHLSVCLSDISAEALKKLKRCPKDFTLRMDFVEGKVLFQSGRGPANNFQIGADLKFEENIVDSKKSDVISIKPSTECSFGSQLIPVENPKEIKSFKSLKSTDSELFNVVSVPFLYNNPYLATSHKSCITFRNDQLMSMAIIAKHIFKSMPQIPSLTNIFEDKVMETPSKTGSREKTQKPSKPKKMDQCK